MDEARELITKELKARCVSFLREHGFKGSFPNLYRVSASFVSLINFQFFSAGGSLCVNLSFVGPNGENKAVGTALAVEQLRIMHTRVHRRLGSAQLGDDRWFSFGRTSYGTFRGEPKPAAQIAEEVRALLEQQALP
jgi:hypothetical protein